jgi:hypothetical protein
VFLFQDRDKGNFFKQPANLNTTVALGFAHASAVKALISKQPLILNKSPSSLACAASQLYQQ